ncbi:MAG: prepilin peptidase [Armatimonadota bacterium]|nr:prepilin peptidase [Armatimonadota bacterium]
MPFYLSAAIAFIYGTVVGSFLNVCIWRMPRDQSIIRPPSHCPNCDGKLRAWELIPLFSYLLLGRKCARCGAPISWRYFGVELLTGLFYIALVYYYGWRLEFFTFALFGSALIAAFFVDLEHWIIPDQLNIFGIVVGVAHDLAALALIEVGHPEAVFFKPVLTIPVPFTTASFPMLQSIVGIVICGAIFYAIAVFGELAFKKEAMGGGDIKLAAAIGANLPISLALLSFFVAVALGSVIGIAWMLVMRAMRREFKSYVPFGPMMVTGAFVVIFLGSRIISAYMGYMMPR